MKASPEQRIAATEGSPIADAVSRLQAAPVALPARALSVLPDLLVSGYFAWLAWQMWTGALATTPRVADDVTFPGIPSPSASVIAVLEAIMLAPQLTLVDAASRMRRRPPWWLIPPLLLGLTAVAPGGAAALQLLWSAQGVLLVPAFWSLWQRGRMFWVLPVASPLERMRARAMAAGRLNAALICGLPPFAWSLWQVAASDYRESMSDQVVLICPALAAYFLLGAIDLWRLQGRAFALRPRVLGWYDALGVLDYRQPL
jgi:hypothetical protein